MDLPDDLSEDYINVGKILILRVLRDMKKDNVNLNELAYDEKIEEVYRDILHPNFFPRDGLVHIKISPGIHEFKQKTMEESKWFVLNVVE